MTKNGDYHIALLQSVRDVPRDEWNILSGDDNPFLSHEFLSLLEESGSVGQGTGWHPAPIILRDHPEPHHGDICGILPAYLKTHSQGEYVFDHSWAQAFEQAGGQYYPKLQIASPFTPATGRRILVSNPKWTQPLLSGAKALVQQNGLSSAHATFFHPTEKADFEENGWLIRQDIQFHWQDQDYGDFDGFLAALSSRKRKDMRKERAKAVEGLNIVHLRGGDIKPHHWDIFWEFYQDTGARKWGTPYLTRAAFDLLGRDMADRILLIFAMDGDDAIAGALNVIGGDTLYGRYWGCVQHRPFLHFEICYYQAIDAALAMGLSRVEAGAQGGHKMARGYAPKICWSAHYLPDPGFHNAVERFLQMERDAIGQERQFLQQHLPYKKMS